MNEYERPYHKVANIFPLLQGDEYESLKNDIAENGLLEPIWLHPDGSIIDGRNRHRACLDTETPPRFRTWNEQGSLVSFVVSLNLHRRHLTSSQRAALAIELLPMLEEEARERQILSGKLYGERHPKEEVPEIFPEPLEHGEAREHAAEIMQTNSRYVQDAKRLATEAPDLFEQVKTGAVTIPQAKREVVKRQTAPTWTDSQMERKRAVEQGQTVVANKKQDHALIQWAQNTGRYVAIDRGSIWGNPFLLNEDGDRETVIEKYAWYYEYKPSLMHRIDSLRGKVLGCWCYPEACHGDVLVERCHG